MNILTHGFHRACEYYWMGLFPEHTFLSFSNNILKWDANGMPMRGVPKNCQRVTRIPGKVDFAVAHTTAGYNYFTARKIPTIRWYHTTRFSEDPKNETEAGVTVYYSHESKDSWGIGEKKFVAYHPIDMNIFNGYVGEKPRAVMCASMPLDWWGGVKGAAQFRKMVTEYEVPYKLVGMNNETPWPQCEPEFVLSEERMIEIFRSYRVYGNTAPYIPRSPLEALAVGMPVVSYLGDHTTLYEELKDAVDWAKTDEDFKDRVMWYIENEPSQDVKRREAMEAFAPEKVKRQWEMAFEAVR